MPEIKSPIEELRKLLREAEKEKKERQYLENLNKEKENKDLLFPLEEKIQQEEEAIKKIKEEFRQKLLLLKQERSCRLREVLSRKASVLTDLNHIREQVGLPPKTLFSTKRRSPKEPPHKYRHIFEDNHIILIIDDNIKEEIAYGDLNVNSITKIFERNNISDPSGSRALGVVRKIRIKLAKREIEKNHSETLRKIGETYGNQASN